MSETKHTPGPWQVLIRWARTGFPLVVKDEAGADICTVAMTGDKSDQANAYLIAAAPDLLEALVALTSNPHLDLGDRVYDVREREGLGWDGPSVKAWSEAVQKATAAIAKAKGARP